MRYVRGMLLFFAIPAFAQLAQVEEWLGARQLIDVSQMQEGTPRNDMIVRVDDLSLPQIASAGSMDAGGFLTFLDLVNMTDAPAKVTVLFLNGQGKPMPVPFAAVNTDGTPCLGCPPQYAAVLSANLGRGQSAQQVLKPNGPAVVGWAAVMAEPPGAVGVTATFMQIVPGRPLFMTGIPPSTAFQRRAWFSANDAGGFTSSAALVNTDPNVSRTFTLIYRSQKGQEMCRTSFSLPSFGHRAFLIRDVLPCSVGMAGNVEIGSPGTFAGVGIWAHESGGFVTQPLLEHN